MTRKRLLAAGTRVAAFLKASVLTYAATLVYLAGVVGCGDSLGLAAGSRYQLAKVNAQPVPALLRTDPSRNYFGFVDSGSVEIVDDTSGFIAFAMHEVVYLDDGDSLTSGWQFRALARLQRTNDRLIVDYRSRDFQLVYGWDFLGVDTAAIRWNSLVILGDSLSERPRTVYLYIER
jgi:hypothetical protein